MKLFRFALLIVVTAAAVQVALAGDIKPYSQAEFDTLAAQGKPVLLDVHADWCPTCRAQKPLIENLMTQPQYKDVTTLVIDFDKDTATLKSYRVHKQSTLIVFKGKQEVGRSVGDTNAVSIESLVKKAIN
jgi:thioredoxin 1